MFYTFLDELNRKAGYCKITASNKHLDDVGDFNHVFLYRKHWRYTDAIRNQYNLEPEIMVISKESLILSPTHTISQIALFTVLKPTMLHPFQLERFHFWFYF